ncbi:MAG: hypothetical protein AAFZ74_13110 [Pseudomonadota bacterium]
MRDKELLRLLNDYNDFLERHDVAIAYLTQSTISVQGAFSLRFDFDVERLTYATDDILNFEAPIEHYNFEQMAGDPDFINAAEQLTFLHSSVSLWRLRIGRRVEAIQQRLEAASE